MIARASKLLARGALCACVLGLAAIPLQGQPSDFTPEELKSAFLCLIPTYVSWPKGIKPDPKNEIIIGVLGDDTFGEKLDEAAQGRSKALGKKYSVKRFKTVSDYEPCQVLFIAPATGINDTAADRLKALLKKLKEPYPVLVSDTAGLTKEGAHVHCVLDANRKLTFYVNVEAAKKGGVKFDALFLARSKAAE